MSTSVTGLQILERASQHDAAAQEGQGKLTVHKAKARKPEQEDSQASQHWVKRLKLANKPINSRQRLSSSQQTHLLTSETTTTHYGVPVKASISKPTQKKTRDKQQQRGTRLQVSYQDSVQSNCTTNYNSLWWKRNATEEGEQTQTSALNSLPSASAGATTSSGPRKVTTQAVTYISNR